MWGKERDEDDGPPTWEEFEEPFTTNFIPEEYREAKATEFEQLKQGNKSVQEYYMEFKRLAKHAPHMVKTEKTKIRSGRSTRPSSSSATPVAPSQARGSHNQAGHRAARGAYRVTQGGRQPRLFSTLDRQSAEASVEVITGSTFSYVTQYFAINLGLEPEQLSELFLVSTLVGESVKVTRVYIGCIVSVQGSNTKIDLIELEMADFNVIMGMDYLSSFYAMLDCHAKIVRFQFPNKEVLDWKGSSASLVGKFISYLKSMPVVREFLEVFPDDLRGLPPERIIDFGIDLMPSTEPITIPPYMMALVELNELREQLKNLFDKGFIQLSVHHGAPCLSRRKMSLSECASTIGS
ncbi:uncharacterized protein [Nicotiana sylvestris]|uniref:uncharacterized protein n=1 Tax=Nicotiana sylvestris TaxID=4096 RepID=UPI00388CC89B